MLVTKGVLMMTDEFITSWNQVFFVIKYVFSNFSSYYQWNSREYFMSKYRYNKINEVHENINL